MYGLPHQKHLHEARMLSFDASEDVPQKFTILLGPSMPIANGANVQNAEDVPLRPNHQSRPLKRSGGARKNGSGIRERIVPAINQAGEVDVKTTAKMTKGISVETADDRVLPVRRSRSG